MGRLCKQLRLGPTTVAQGMPGPRIELACAQAVSQRSRAALLAAQAMFQACSVCHAWRRVGRRVFFSQPWKSATLLCHPLQLFSTVHALSCPRALLSKLLLSTLLQHPRMLLLSELHGRL